MIAQNTVKVNGKWFYAGQEITGAEKSAPIFSENSKTYTKTEIMRMSTAELKAFAAVQGIENPENLTGSELKKVLIEKLGL